MDCTKSAKKATENGSHLEFLINTWYHIYSIPIGFSDLEKVGLDTKFVFLGWPKTKIWAIQFSKDFDGGHFEKCPKSWGRPTYKTLTSWLLISGVPWTKWYHSWRILGGGGVTLCAHGLNALFITFNVERPKHDQGDSLVGFVTRHPFQPKNICSLPNMKCKTARCVGFSQTQQWSVDIMCKCFWTG